MIRTTAILLLMVSGTLSTTPVAAEDVHLLCAGSAQVVVGQTTNPHTGMPNNIYGSKDFVREIRFDEEAGELWYRGADGLSKRNIVEDWIPAEDVTFEESEITATFKRNVSATLSHFGSKAIAMLDRYTGIWRLDSLLLQCELFDSENRQF